MAVEKWKRFRQFLTEVWSELKKTTWPSQKEVVNTTIVVIFFVLLCAGYLWGVDTILSRGVNYLFEVFS